MMPRYGRYCRCSVHPPATPVSLAAAKLVSKFLGCSLQEKTDIIQSLQGQLEKEKQSRSQAQARAQAPAHTSTGVLSSMNDPDLQEDLMRRARERVRGDLKKEMEGTIQVAVVVLVLQEILVHPLTTGRILVQFLDLPVKTLAAVWC